MQMTLGAYATFLSEIEAVIHPDYQPVINHMRAIDPHDLVTTGFLTTSAARGYVWSLFLKECREVEACWEESAAEIEGNAHETKKGGIE